MFTISVLQVMNNVQHIKSELTPVRQKSCHDMVVCHRSFPAVNLLQPSVVMKPKTCLQSLANVRFRFNISP